MIEQAFAIILNTPFDYRSKLPAKVIGVAYRLFVFLNLRLVPSGFLPKSLMAFILWGI